MLKKHIILIGILLSLMLLTIATTYYAGGSQKDPNSVGYDWQNNYLCNLFNEKAVNGALNTTTRLWAISGMLILCASFALFFYRFSTKITAKTPAKIIKYCGIGSMLFAFLVVTPYHDLMTTLSSILALLAVFYLTVFIFKSKLTPLKLLCVVSLGVIYLNNYIYYTHHFLSYLPILQKLSFLIGCCLILSLDYFTEKEDFYAKKGIYTEGSSFFENN